MALSNYLEVELLDHVFRSATYTPPADIYLALFTVAPDDTGGGTEVTGGSYARQIVTFSAAVSPDGKISNNAAFTYTNLPSCTIVASGTYDAITGGNLLTYATLGTSRVVGAGESLSVAIADLNIYFD